MLAIDSVARRIELAPRCEPGRGWPCWWYARIAGASHGETVTVRVISSRRPHRNAEVLAGRWALPDRALVSPDDVHWTPTPAGATNSNEVVYSLAAPADPFWIARGPPFLPAHTETSIEATGPLRILPNYEVVRYVKTEDERARMSRTWVQRNGGPNVVAVTLETRWNLPESTAENDRRLGADLGRAIVRFLGFAVQPRETFHDPARADARLTQPRRT